MTAFGFRVSGCGPRVSGFGSRVSGFGSRVSGSGVRVSGFGWSTPSSWQRRVSGFGCRVSGFWFRVEYPFFLEKTERPNGVRFGPPDIGSALRLQVPGSGFRFLGVSGFGFRVSGGVPLLPGEDGEAPRRPEIRSPGDGRQRVLFEVRGSVSTVCCNLSLSGGNGVVVVELSPRPSGYRRQRVLFEVQGSGSIRRKTVFCYSLL